MVRELAFMSEGFCCDVRSVVVVHYWMDASYMKSCRRDTIH